MKPRHALPILLLAALVGACSESPTQTRPLLAASAIPVLGSENAGCASVVGTFYGDHESQGWVGTLYLSIAGGTVETPGFVDAGTGNKATGASGGFSGTETNTITFGPAEDGNNFQIVARYNASPAGTPGLYILHETGDITNGAGRFAGVSGHVAVEGPFTLPTVGDVAPQWIAEMHGTICGLQ